MDIPKGFWLKLYPVDPATGNTVEVLFCTANRPSACYIEAGKEYKPYMESYPQFGIKVFDGAFDGSTEVSLDDIDITGTESYVANLNQYVWDGVDALLYKGAANESTFANLELVFTGAVERAPDISMDKAKFKFTDNGYRLEKDFLTATYDGLGGLGGSAQLEGVFKPVVYGSPLSVEPILIDSAYVVFQYDGGTQRMTGINGVYENGLTFGSSTSTVSWQGSAAATLTALKALTLTVGQWADAPSIGCFRLGGEPKSGGVVTCDPVCPISSITGVLSDLITKAVGASATVSSNLTSFLSATHNQTVNDYITDQIQIRELVETYLKEVGIHSGTKRERFISG